MNLTSDRLEQPVELQLKVNGRSVRRTVSPRTHLADFLRHELQLTATHVGCEHGVCGACTVVVDGDIVRACLVLAAQLEGCNVTTLEGLDASGAIADLQEAFVRHNALQCGFCTPGMLLCAAELLERAPTTDREKIRDQISGNYCRCTGYHAIVSAVAEVAERRLAAAHPQATVLKRD
jgi:carbon-monoxide dehydrogenase small subunit